MCVCVCVCVVGGGGAGVIVEHGLKKNEGKEGGVNKREKCKE